MKGGSREYGDFRPGVYFGSFVGRWEAMPLCMARTGPLRGMQGKVQIFDPSRPYIVWVRDTFRGSARINGADTMSNIDNPSEINVLPEGSPDLERPAERERCSNETLADLALNGTSPVREVSIFAGMKKPKRSKPTFTFPSVPPLF